MDFREPGFARNVVCRRAAGRRAAGAAAAGAGEPALADQARPAQARRWEILGRINGPQQAAREMGEIEAGLALETGSIRELFKPGIRPALWIGILLPFLSQICGINVIIYYGPRVLEQAAVSRDAALLCQVLFGVVSVAATLAAVFTVNKLGRKTLLGVGIAGVGVTLVLAGVLFAVSAPAAGPVCRFRRFSGLFQLLLRTGLLDYHVRDLPHGDPRPGHVDLRVLALGRLQPRRPDVSVGPEAYGPARSFWIYGLTIPAALLYVLTRVPETKGKTLEEIERRWTDHG